MRRKDPAFSAFSSSAAIDLHTLKRAVGRFLAVCKAEHLPPADVLVRFDAFLAAYNAWQKQFLLSSTSDGAPAGVSDRGRMT